MWRIYVYWWIEPRIWVFYVMLNQNEKLWKSCGGNAGHGDDNKIRIYTMLFESCFADSIGSEVWTCSKTRLISLRFNMSVLKAFFKKKCGSVQTYKTKTSKRWWIKGEKFHSECVGVRGMINMNVEAACCGVRDENSFYKLTESAGIVRHFIRGFIPDHIDVLNGIWIFKKETTI